MTTQSKTADRAKMVGACALVALGLWALGLPQKAFTDDEHCKRPVSFTANWTVKKSVASVKWGVSESLITERAVRSPWQRINVNLPCGSNVRLQVTLDRYPGKMLAAITANSTVYDARPQDSLGTRWSVEAVVNP